MIQKIQKLFLIINNNQLKFKWELYIVGYYSVPNTILFSNTLDKCN